MRDITKPVTTITKAGIGVRHPKLYWVEVDNDTAHRIAFYLRGFNSELAIQLVPWADDGSKQLRSDDIPDHQQGSSYYRLNDPQREWLEAQGWDYALSLEWNGKNGSELARNWCVAFLNRRHAVIFKLVWGL
jgi:hypothetical protein